MDNLRKKVNEEIARGWIGPNLSCPYYASHFQSQDCSFCYCPFYPCNDPAFGNIIHSRHGDIWNCSQCLFIHRQEVAKFVFSEIERLGITDASDPRFTDIFRDVKARFWRKGKALMVVGATSDAGKSVTVVALCRILHNKGYLVAPFKSQNMSLNSMVTRDGSEIAATQILQARAAGLTNADHHMNPLLLKPKGDRMCQVVVCGKAFKDCSVEEYYGDFIPNEGFRVVKEHVEFLKDRYDIIVMEGAGSAAEANIYSMDIANMRAAEIADADVILVVNVERGGSYAYALGTLEMMSDADRRRVKGIILNNLRGMKESYTKGTRQLEEMTGIPVIGIIPHADAVLPCEDAESLGGSRIKGEGKALVGVIRFPHLADFTDLDPLLLEDVSVVYVESPKDLKGVDAIVIPGTNSTVADYLWMRDTGIADAVKALWRRVPILGICGGYQMMGRLIDDSKGLESGVPGSYEGLSFFNNNTSFNDRGRCALKNEGTLLKGEMGPVAGFELHLGTSTVNEEPLFAMARFHADPVKEGSVREEDMTFGTYQHGIFDGPAFRRYFLSFVKHDGKRIESFCEIDYGDFIEENIRMFAKTFEENLDTVALDKLIGGSE